MRAVPQRQIALRKRQRFFACRQQHATMHRYTTNLIEDAHVTSPARFTDALGVRKRRNRNARSAREPDASVLMHSTERARSVIHLHDPWAGYGHDEFSAAVAILLLLMKNFIRKIPTQQQHIVGHFLEQFFGPKDRKAFSGHIKALFMNAAVHYEIHKLVADADVVDHRGALGSCPISCDPLPVGLESLKQFPQ